MSTTITATPVRQPSAQPRSTTFQAWVNGEKADVLLAEKADFFVFECAGPTEVAIHVDGNVRDAALRPLSSRVIPAIETGMIRFTLGEPRWLCLEVPGLKPLFVYANAPELDKPRPDDARVRYYAAGKVHQAGEIALRDGETLYIEAGAVVRGFVRSKSAAKVAIRGQGILDGSYHSYQGGDRVRSVIFEDCRDVTVADIVMIEPTSWMLVFGRCDQVHVRGLKQIGSCMSSDGIDICGSRNVLVENCCLRNDDDNIAVKSGIFSGNSDWRGDIDNVLVRDCVLYNGQPGNVMEIGYELSTNRVSNVSFENIDVIGAHGEGAVFSIHNGDRAVIENIRWDDIRVEHYWDKLVDFRVVKSRYNRDPERGRIHDILLRDIQVAHSIFNPGCSHSLISGYSPDKPVSDVVFENFRLNEKTVLSADALELHTRNVEGIVFR